MAHLFLSPHYDDAVYSCGGTIYQLSRQKQDVVIITVMAGEPELPLLDTPVLEDNHQRWELGANPVQARRHEDAVAARVLGVNTLYIETITDCIYRRTGDKALYPDEASLWGAVHPDDPALEVLKGIDISRARAIYAPLGVGQHVDHKIVRDWALALIEKHPFTRVYFYEDYPYMRDRAAVMATIKDFPLPLRPHAMMLIERSIQYKIQAMLAYYSQISTFWKDTTAMAQEVRQTFASATSNLFVERYYQVVQKP